MSFLSKLFSVANPERDCARSVISTGRNKYTGGHDHRTNRGDNRTPAQKTGDIKRSKD